ncbi:MAG TPA: maltose alpha-D-glucosyltransferase [Polyangiaceae bacterium]|nr:maltose alpha-D-glucosyltransferase [Polyangiaceae bacterium]
MRDTHRPRSRRSSSVSSADPEWYKDALIYELHVRAFADSNGDGIGDFAGLIDRLDYLADLGVTALWLLPFYPSPLRDGGYDIADYWGVHASYGTLDDFKRFLEAAHARGMRVITELVINHTSSDHVWFQRARTSAPGSPEREFYVWSDSADKYADARVIFQDFEVSNWTWDPLAKAYYWHRFYSHQPDLNFDNPAVHAAIFEVLDHWLDLGVDGVRLDAVPYLYEREGTNCENLPETHAFLRKLRAHVDAKFKNRMLLAEANQWPVDAAAYFGQGDECHMNFHFPLMPRLFMALHSEDAFPIIDILTQTPTIPESCQWATFLRNHDELTLEMVTDEDRDLMYRVYAVEDRARINLGIRRRLFPLVRDRRRVELLTALLFSLPGTPVLYYGDEIGMGDNIYLGDRDGVRTPMQWDSDRNAGFSKANPQKLYLPVVVDPEFHYEAVNVAAQEANPASLLWSMKQLIAMRRRHRVLSRGKLRFLNPSNPKVLAFLREDGSERILIVANLSRNAQYTELELGEHLGSFPREMFGLSRFPEIAERPYPLTLGGHQVYWFSLETNQGSRAGTKLGPLSLIGNWQGVVNEPARSALAESLSRYAREQRWYRSKSMPIKHAELEEIFLFGEANVTDHCLIVLGVELEDGARESYVMPLRFTASGSSGPEAASSLVSDVEIHVPGEAQPMRGSLIDASSSRVFAETLLGLLREDRLLKSEHGTLSGELYLPALGAKPQTGSLEPRFLPLEQSNSTILYGSSWLLKLLRKVEAGPNVELEIGRFLAGASPRPKIPEPVGALLLSSESGTRTLAVVSEYLDNRGSAWSVTLESLFTFFERVLSAPGSLPAVALPNASAAECTEEVPDALQHLASPYFTLTRLLAERTAELHRALGRNTREPGFGQEPFTQLHQHSLYQSAHAELARCFKKLRQQQRGLPSDAAQLASRVLAVQATIDQRLRRITETKVGVTRIRCHGDYHLGQVLFSGDDFMIIDFEGEPGRLVSERRYKRNPLRDVASMLRSFAYAAESALRSERVRPEDRARLAPWAEAFRAWVCVSFVRTYLAAIAGEAYCPDRPATAASLLEFYELEKVVYEINYELNNRPDWLTVPLAGLVRIVQVEH